ncbi:MAG: hypothetical protein LUG59_10695, partial [Enterocloster clostridioformis]|nr:hypothetical protein [Enterocloster clostridioformis]
VPDPPPHAVSIIAPATANAIIAQLRNLINLLPPLKWFHLSISQRLLCGCQLLLFMQLWNIIRALNCMLLFFIAGLRFKN